MSAEITENNSPQWFQILELSDIDHRTTMLNKLEEVKELKIHKHLKETVVADTKK